MHIIDRVCAFWSKPQKPAPEPRPVQFSWSRPDWYDEAKEAERLEEDEWARIDKTTP